LSELHDDDKTNVTIDNIVLMMQ